MENMLKRPPDTDSSSSMGDDSSGREEGKQNNADDVELGFVAPDDSVQTKTHYADDKDDSEFTQVLIPRPGHAIADNSVKKVEDLCMDNEKKIKRGSSSRNCFLRTSKVGQDFNNEENGRAEGGVSCSTDEAGKLNNPVDEGVTERRAVPIFCAVCLMKYEISDRVCWSSNSECSHMFHEDCMLLWLGALGREDARRKRFPANPSERKLLDFKLTCPCCRQDFISRDLILGTEENV
jgi:hypothetical protein